MKFIVLSGNQELIDSINRYLKYVHSIKGVENFLINNSEKKGYENFLLIKDWLEGLFENNITEMKDTLAFIDLPISSFSDIKPISDDSNSLASLLYLAFPEIYWFFPVPISKGSPGDDLDWLTFNNFHTITNDEGANLGKYIEVFLSKYTPLFDPTGARTQIVQQTLEHMKKNGEDKLSERPFFCKRKQKALVIDEELPYSYIHAYVAYKMDHRAMITPTKTILDKVRELQKKEKSFDISFEDISLSFPDEKISNELAKREGEEKKEENQYVFFQKIQKRIFVTIGEKGELKKKNREYRKKLKSRGDLEYCKILYKPYAGIFNLIKAAKLKFEKKKPKRPQHETITGHSAPGRFGMIADILLNRSRNVLDKVQNVTDAIYAAMLALQAQEILGGRTATLSIKSLSLKHQAEVMAECMFYGVEHNFDVESRFKEIEKELDIIGIWFSKSKKDIMIYNSELNIVNELARIFRNYSQFDEEQKCLSKVRTLNRKIYKKRNKFWGWLVSPLRWYFEFLVGSLPRFLAAIALWPALFTLLFYLFLPNTNNVSSLCNAFICSVNSFFALQVTIIDNVPGVPILSIFATLLGFFHLGIFISHLYTIVSRR